MCKEPRKNQACAVGVSPLGPAQRERGLTLLEVLLSTVVLGIALTGFLMALSTASTTSSMASDQNQLVFLATQELEALRKLEFNEIPFAVTAEPGYTEEVPDYFNDLAISQTFGGDCLIVASSDLKTASAEYDRDYAFDGKRANINKRWMGGVNDLAWVETGGGPSAGGPGGGGGPSAGGPGGGPSAGGNFAPSNYQYIYCAFPKLTKISRILYDNRFNVTEQPGAPPGDFDYLPHDKNVWQRSFDFFWTDKVLGYGEIYDPWVHLWQPLAFFKDLGYGSTGIQVVFDDAKNPLSAGIIGLHNINTYADFDANFHWPYASEIEVYGFNRAAYYCEEYTTRTGEKQYDNVVMYFPNYLGSGFDLGRHTYVTAPSLEAARVGSRDLIRVVLEFYPATSAHKDPQWQRETWWQRDSDELARFQTSFYRNEGERVDNLPNLRAYPSHVVYGNNEDLRFPFTVPGATSIRAHFSVFDLEPNPGTDQVVIEDAQGNVYGVPAYGNDLLDKWTWWIPGDTIVIHFISNGSLCSYDMGYGGFKVNAVEVGSVAAE